MVGYYKRTNPKYSVRAEIHKQLHPEDGSSLYYENSPSNFFMAKDNGFTTTYNSTNGHIVKVTTGELETKDLLDGDIMPDDYVNYGGNMFIVTSVKFSEDNDVAKSVSKRVSGTTLIQLRR